MGKVQLLSLGCGKVGSVVLNLVERSKSLDRGIIGWMREKKKGKMCWRTRQDSGKTRHLLVSIQPTHPFHAHEDMSYIHMYPGIDMKGSIVLFY